MMAISNKLFLGSALIQIGMLCWYAGDIFHAVSIFNIYNYIYVISKRVNNSNDLILFIFIIFIHFALCSCYQKPGHDANFAYFSSPELIQFTEDIKTWSSSNILNMYCSFNRRGYRYRVILPDVYLYMF